MRTNLDDITAIRSRFLDLWDASIPVALDNEPPAQSPTQSIHAIFQVLPSDERRKTLGSKKYEQIGRCYLRIYAPAGSRDETVLTLAESFATNFREWTSPDYAIRCETPTYSAGIDNDGDYMVMVAIPYRSQHS